MDASANSDGFQLHDPRYDTLYYFYTANAATAKADQLGATRLQYRRADGALMQIEKRSGQWVRDDGKSLHVVQRAIDSKAFVALVTRALERTAVPAPQASCELDYHHAECDLFALLSIQEPLLREVAVDWMAKLSAVSSGYRARLDLARRVASAHDLLELNAALTAAGIAA